MRRRERFLPLIRSSFVGAAVLGLFLAPPAGPVGGAETYDPSSTFAAAMKETWPRGMVPSGSGFHVAEGRVLTAAHVIAGCRVVWVRRRGRTAAATLAAIDVRHDLAMLDAPELRALPRSVFTDPVVGRDVVLWGHPKKRGDVAEEPAARASRAVDLREERVTVPLLVVDGTAPEGFSGGPVVDDVGAVVGMAIARQNGGDRTVVFAVPSDALRRFLLYMDVVPDVVAAGGRRSRRPIGGEDLPSGTDGAGRPSAQDAVRDVVVRVGCSR